MDFQYEHERGATTSTVIWGVIIVLVVIAGIWWFLSQDNTNAVPNVGNNESDINIQDNAITDQDEGEVVEDLENNPSEFTGQSITAVGEVAKAYDQYSFQLASRDLIEDDVLVVSKNPLPPSLLEDTNDVVDEEEVVSVTGVARMMTVADVEQELGVNLDSSVDADFKGQKPVIIADTVTVQSENTTP